MEKNGILNIDKSRWGKGRSHIICINKESELVWIQNNLSNIEKEIERMSDTAKKYQNNWSNSVPPSSFNIDRYFKFIQYHTAVSIMLGILLNNINKLPDSTDVPKNQLYVTIFKLIEKLTLQHQNLKNLKQYLRGLVRYHPFDLDPELKSIVRIS